MSSITPSTQVNPLIQPDIGSTPLPTTTVAETQAVTVSSPSYKPLWLAATPGSSTSFDLLGLRNPKSNGDIATMLAEVSLALEATTDESKKSGMIARLGSLISAMTKYDVAAYQKTVDIKTEAVTNTTATKAKFDADKASLIGQRNSAPNADAKANVNFNILQLRIDNADREIADLNKELANTTAGSSEETSLKSQIATLNQLKSDVSGAIGYFRNEFNYYSGEVNKFQGYINAEMQKPAKERNQGAIDGWTATRNYNQNMLDSRRSYLNEYAEIGRPGAEWAGWTDRKGVNGDGQDLSDKLTRQTQDMTAAKAALTTVAIISLVASSFAATTFNAAKQGTDIDESGRSLGLEDEFEEIADQLKAAGASLLADLRDIDAATEKLSQEQRRKVETLAVGLLSSIASLLTSTSEIQPLDIAAIGLQQSGGRFRLQA